MITRASDALMCSSLPQVNRNFSILKWVVYEFQVVAQNPNESKQIAGLFYQPSWPVLIDSVLIVYSGSVFIAVFSRQNSFSSICEPNSGSRSALSVRLVQPWLDPERRPSSCWTRRPTTDWSRSMSCVSKWTPTRRWVANDL